MNESVLRGEHGEVRRAIRGLRGLIVTFDEVRGQAAQPLPVAREPLAEPDGPGRRSSRGVQSRLDHRLREAYVGGDAESFVDRAPLPQEASVTARIRKQELSPGGVVDDGPGNRLEKSGYLIAPLVDVPRELVAVQQMCQTGLLPVALAHPVALGREDGQQTAVYAAPERDEAVRNREDVLPEGIAGPESLQGGEIVVVACNRVKRRRAERRQAVRQRRRWRVRGGYGSLGMCPRCQRDWPRKRKKRRKGSQYEGKRLTHAAVSP